MVAVAVRSQLDVRALPMTQDAQIQLVLAALLILLLASHYLPAEMLEGCALLLLNQATAQVFSTPMAALETAAPVAREVATRRTSAQLLEATASERTVPTCVPGRSSNSVVKGTVAVAWILTDMVMGTLLGTGMESGMGTGMVGNGEDSNESDQNLANR
ncbi:uncharacterized protein LOC135214248 [Macrobrachium nipponense]|uniref:uncharacterized protein LOC135214248 n=1 Tax=Macrobrachium nipponense TaxID=159736 RepID=UPI0030C8BEB2